jgi:hypothetical protein
MEMHKAAHPNRSLRVRRWSSAPSKREREPGLAFHNTKEPESYDDVTRNDGQANDQLRVHHP